MSEQSTIPTVLAIAGLDPSGGAGIQADIEAILSMGCHACTTVTTITAQDTRNAYSVHPLAPTQVLAQARAVLDDIPVAAFKIGLLGSAANAQAVATLLQEYPEIPVVLDPVLVAAGGAELAEKELLPALREYLLPEATLLTPNTPEARRLAEHEDIEECGEALLVTGCEYVLVTGADEPGQSVINHLFGPDGLHSVERWPRFPASYHGSGCTLSAAAAGLLAQGNAPAVSAQQAQQYTWEAIQAGYRPGRGQFVPSRLFWAQGSFA